MFDFAIAGFPKCGTSSVWAAFKRAGVPMLDGEPPLKNILRIGSEFASEGQSSGFKSALLAYNPKIIKELCGANPNFRLLIGLRDPIEWAWSWYWYQRKLVEDAWQTPASGKKPAPVYKRPDLRDLRAMDFIQADADYPNYSRRHGKFHLFLEEIFRYLPAENIMLFDLLQLANDWEQTVGRCLEFVGERHAVPQLVRVNTNERKPSEDIDNIFEMAAYEYYESTFLPTAQFLKNQGYADLAGIFLDRRQRYAAQSEAAN